MFLPMESRNLLVDPSTCTHSIELNQIHFSLAWEFGLLKAWIFVSGGVPWSEQPLPSATLLSSVRTFQAEA
jgi:hypothetical protein